MNQMYPSQLQVAPGASQYIRYLIDIRNPGGRFRDALTNYDIGHIPGISQTQLHDIQLQIYKESANQIFDEMTNNITMFMHALQNMPRFKYFDQHEVLFSDMNLRPFFIQAFRQFALDLMQITFHMVPYTPDKEIYLESIGPEYMSVVMHPKNIQR